MPIYAKVHPHCSASGRRACSSMSWSPPSFRSDSTQIVWLASNPWHNQSHHPGNQVNECCSILSYQLSHHSEPLILQHHNVWLYIVVCFDHLPSLFYLSETIYLSICLSVYLSIYLKSWNCIPQCKIRHQTIPCECSPRRQFSLWRYRGLWSSFVAFLSSVPTSLPLSAAWSLHSCHLASTQHHPHPLHGHPERWVHGAVWPKAVEVVASKPKDIDRDQNDQIRLW